MALKIRLMRVGKKKQPHYRLVVVEEASKRDGAVVEVIGHYHPLQEVDDLTVDVERALAWLAQGAQPTEAARRLLSRAGVLRLWHERRFGPKGAPGAEPVSS
ncbi:MAG: 30S ribosomal protein S16 [Candidatus Bipolaricaulaceae bacterium]|nr:30S ribosomal protein S16 [Candidatus Bipolaricaulota bacterium]MCX7843986.1 30S ribosomal protein S16 [Candidatus Bipolaricaulota bacterium]MDW8151740.1 30S ribosomal protein S16 [Candidatus Bipolaricaulota bacterium]